MPAEPPNAPHEPASQVYEMIKLDFYLIKDEISSRTEFNRRALNLQISLITGLLAAGLIKDFSAFDPFIIQVVCLSVVLINSVFLFEINQNNFYILLAAHYLTKILNRRAKDATGTVITEWECFLYTKREKSKSFASRLAFFLDAHFLMSVIFVVIATTMLLLSVYRTGAHHPYVLCIYAAFAYPLNILCIHRHFSVPSQVGHLVRPSDVKAFLRKYSD